MDYSMKCETELRQLNCQQESLARRKVSWMSGVGIQWGGRTGLPD